MEKFPHILLVWMWNGAAALENRQPLKRLNIELPFETQQFIPLLVYTCEKSKHMSSQNVYTYAHGSIIHNSQKVGTTEVSINWWMDKKMWYIRTIKHNSALKRKNMCYIMDKPWKYFTSWKKPDIKGSHVCMMLFICNVQKRVTVKGKEE